jgi:hypothetical protein
MRRLTILVLLAALAAPVAACTDDSTGGTRSELDSFVEGFMSTSDGTVTRADARCVGRKLLPELSAKGRDLLNSSKGDIEDLSTADQDALFDSFDACISIEALAASIAKALTQGDSATSPEAADCVSQKIVEHYQHSGDLMRELRTAGQQSSLTSLVTDCVLGAVTTTTI